MKLYRCPICRNIIFIVEGNVHPVRCCGQEPVELIANTTDGAFEKHVPAYEMDGDNINVTVGEVEHPMTEEHYIMFVALVDKENVNIVKLKPTDKPKATFKYVKGSKIYEYCNLHGLWVKEVE